MNAKVRWTTPHNSNGILKFETPEYLLKKHMRAAA